MSNNEALVEFKTVVADFNITPRTLRYYEYLELISPDRHGRKRFYSRREIARLKLILQGRRFGFKLEEIRQWLELYDPQSGNEAQLRSWIEMADEQLDDLRARYEDLATIIADLEEQKRYAEMRLQSSI